jgi:tyrosinase
LKALTPFHKNDNGQFWTSEDVRSITQFAYTYPELVGLNEDDASSLVSKVNGLYGPNATSQFSQKPSNTSEPVERNSLNLRSLNIAGAATFVGQRQYIANIQVQKFSLDGSFNIYVFLGGEPGSDPKRWTDEESFVGATGILSQPLGADIPDQEVKINAVVPLTAALEAHVKTNSLGSMNEDIVGQFLKDNLKWRISNVSKYYCICICIS